MKSLNMPISIILALLLHTLVLALLVWQDSASRQVKIIQPSVPIIKATMSAEDPATTRREKALQDALEEQQKQQAKAIAE